MESIIVAVLVGVIVGGVSTWLTHNFDRWRRREIHQEGRHRELREMIEALMRLARAEASGLAEYEIAMIEGAIRGTGLQAIEETRVRNLEHVRRLEERHPFFLWRPWRIEDAELSELASQLQDANTQAGLLMYDLLRGDVRTTDEWKERAKEASAKIETALKQTDLRLDELEW
jgi:hypothetical protein